MIKHIQLTLISIMFVIGLTASASGRQYDATLSLIIYAAGNNDERDVAKELGKNFTNVQSFDATKNTNFYLHYYLTDENFVQYSLTRNGRTIDADSGVETQHGTVGGSRYEEYKKDQKYSIQFAGGERENKVSVVVKPYKGTMVLYNSYGTELLRVESQDHYKTESAALKNSIKQIRRAIDRNGDKMAIRQKLRSLFSDYGELRENQKQKVDALAYIAHKDMLEQMYGEVAQVELPAGMVPYANLYSSIKDYRALEQILDTDAVIFDNPPAVKRLPGHLINEIIKADAPDDVIEKVAAAYSKNDFQELDINNLTPLWAAISQKDTALMEKLIALGANVNQITNVNGSYLTPLMLSAQLGDKTTSEVLVNRGARKELTTPSGFTAWSTAMWQAKYDHAEYLWPTDLFDFNSQEAQNLFVQAAYYGSTDKVKKMIENGVPITSRGVNGDNVVISAIKGINTFSIEPDFQLPGATEHSSGSKVFWDIIAEAQTAGFDDPYRNTTDTLRQTVLFYAYPEGSNSVKDEHLDLISKIIQFGVNPEITNVNGQNADQVYQDARLAYLDELYESQLKDINEERRDAAELAQIKQDEARDQALESIGELDSFKTRARATQNARRLELFERQDRRARQMRARTQSTEFERDTSDVTQNLDVAAIKDAVDEKIREVYANDLKIANDLALQRIDELEEMIDGLKQDEVDNAASRKVKITRLVAQGSD